MNAREPPQAQQKRKGNCIKRVSKKIKKEQL